MTPEELIQRVMTLMDWDENKALLWFREANPHFGNFSPEYLVEAGRTHKVLSFIKAAEEENKQ